MSPVDTWCGKSCSRAKKSFPGACGSKCPVCPTRISAILGEGGLLAPGGGGTWTASQHPTWPSVWIRASGCSDQLEQLISTTQAQVERWANHVSPPHFSLPHCLAVLADYQRHQTWAIAHVISTKRTKSLALVVPDTAHTLNEICGTTFNRLQSHVKIVTPPLVIATEKSQINTVPTPTVAWTRP